MTRVIFCLITLLFSFSGYLPAGSTTLSKKSALKKPASMACQHDVTLTEHQMSDLEMLLVGAFAPLEGFLTKADYDEVVQNCRLTSGKVWPMPITLDIDKELAQSLNPGDKIGLKDAEGTLLAILTASDIWEPNKLLEAREVYKTESTDHPGVAHLLERKDFYIGGKLTKIRVPHHADFSDLRKTPSELKAWFKENNIDKVVAFQTRNPMHRAHVEITRQAAKQVGAHLLINPIVGPTKPGDVDPYTRVRCYRKVQKNYSDIDTTLSVLPLAMRMAGPREALWHALIRKNYGCTHFVVGRDHAGPGVDRNGNNFYGPYDAQEMVSRYSSEIGIDMVPFRMMVYIKNEDRYVPMDQVQPGQEVATISGTELRRRLKTGEEIPEWFSYPEVVQELRKSYPAPSKKGLTVFFTGLSGSGKSTLGKALSARLREIEERSISLLDGDIIRRNLSSGLGFSQKDRSTNVRRVGYVASEISKAGGIAICCLIAPYEDDRSFNQKMVTEAGGSYVEVYVDTSIDTCESRDVKGLYAKARSGLIKGFTGIDDPYEAPAQPSLVVGTADQEVDEVVDSIIEYLSSEGFIEKVAA